VRRVFVACVGSPGLTHCVHGAPIDGGGGGGGGGCAERVVSVERVALNVCTQQPWLTDRIGCDWDAPTPPLC
jgi:hypothetical protein